MSTFIDPVKIRRLAATGDPFYKGAAWILDQQDAARIDTTDYDSEWTRRAPNARDEWDGYALCGPEKAPRSDQKPRSRPRTRAANFMPNSIDVKKGAHR